jgi:hypothetical protein
MIASLDMLRNLFIVVIFAYFSTSAFAVPKPARSNSSLKEVYFNLGTHTQFYNAVQMNGSGRLRKLDWTPVVGIGAGLPMTKSFIFLPEFNWVLPQTHEESKIISNLFMFRFDVGYDVIEYLRLRMGTSLMWANQQGRGGSTQMNNGTGQSTFYYPEENRSSLNNTLDFGVEAKYDSWAFRLQTYTYSVFRKEQRQLSYSLFLTYYWKK